METSDSEYFESADEDFQSDDENTETVKSVTKSDENRENKKVQEVTTQLKNVKVSETREERVASDLDSNKNKDNSDTLNFEKDDENNVNTRHIKKKEDVKTEPAKKLVSKIGKNIDTTDKKTKDTKVEQVKVIESNTDNNTVASDDKIEDKPPQTLSSKSEPKPVGNKTEEEKHDEEENLWDDSEIDWGKEAAKENVEENLWENDDWEPVEQPEQLPEQKKETPVTNTGWGSWGNWGVSSILSTATQSVSTFTQGISTALETGIGVPEPEELARINHEEKEKLKEKTLEHDDKTKGFGLGNLVMGVSHLTKLVETTGTKVISGGLDTLESIGKKTMEVLQEGDPGLKKKRAFLKIDQDKPVLSQLLREAKEKAEEENKILEQQHFAKKAKNYETLFDDHQGLVHLEALEMLSKQCDIKLQTLLESYTGDALTDMQETMDQVKELCELPDEDEDEQANWTEILEKLNSAVSEISIPITYKKLIETWEETETWLNNLKLEVCDERELHQQAVETLAQLTAIAVEQFHKAGELLLVKEHRSTADEADSLVQLTTSLTSLIGIVAGKFSDKLNTKSSNSTNKEIVNGLITNVFFEAANSSSYIQDAFQLLIPVLQVGAV